MIRCTCINNPSTIFSNDRVCRSFTNCTGMDDIHHRLYLFNFCKIYHIFFDIFFQDFFLKMPPIRIINNFIIFLFWMSYFIIIGTNQPTSISFLFRLAPCLVSPLILKPLISLLCHSKPLPCPLLIWFHIFLPLLAFFKGFLQLFISLCHNPILGPSPKLPINNNKIK